MVTGSASTVVFDLGETLVDETRQWEIVARAAGIPFFTLSAMLGSVIERGLDHWSVWDELGVERVSAVDQGYTVSPELFYPDAIPALRTLKEAGYRVGIVANQPENIIEQIESMNLELNILATSASIGFAKPDPRFFEHIVELCAVPSGEIVYVGDRIDNDVLPAEAAGLRAVFIRRGPWGYIHARSQDANKIRYRIDRLGELPDLLKTINTISAIDANDAADQEPFTPKE